MPKALYATFEALPGYEQTLRRMVADLTRAVRAEPGCLRFVAYTRADNPRAYHVDEVYADAAPPGSCSSTRPDAPIVIWPPELGGGW